MTDFTNEKEGESFNARGRKGGSFNTRERERGKFGRASMPRNEKEGESQQRGEREGDAVKLQCQGERKKRRFDKRERKSFNAKEREKRRLGKASMLGKEKEGDLTKGRETHPQDADALPTP